MPVQGVLAVFPRDVVLSALLSRPASLMPNLLLLLVPCLIGSFSHFGPR